MTYNNIESVLYSVGTWFANALPLALAEANGQIAAWKTDAALLPDDSMLSLSDLFEDLTFDFEVQPFKKVGVGTLIPASGPFPYLLLIFDDLETESAGQLSDWITLHLKLIVALQENNEKRLPPTLFRYIDAFVHAIGKDGTLGGIVDSARFSTVDKEEVPSSKVGFVVGNLSVKFELICE
jgi:hypothetical protein